MGMLFSLWQASTHEEQPTQELRSMVMPHWCLLHVYDFAVHKRYLQIFIDIELFWAKIDDLVRFAKSGLHLIGGLPFLNGLRFGLLLGLLRGLLILSLSSLSCLASLLPALILLGVFADREELPDRVLNVA